MKMKLKYSLADALTHHSTAAVANAIKAYGIIGVDAYGRSGNTKDQAIKDQALRLVAEYRLHTLNWYESHNPDEELGEAPYDIFDDANGEYHQIGWEQKPDFIDEHPNLSNTDARQARTLLTIIAALCKRHDVIDYSAKGAAAEIMKLTESLGIKIDEDTVLKYLKLIPEALQTKK